MNNPPGADSKTGPPSVTPARHFLRRVVVQLLRLRVWLTERGPGELWESNYFWAAIVGLCGAFSSVAFREALSHLQWILLHYNGPLEGAATTLPWWGRLLMPAAGGLIAGSILLFGQKWSTAGKSADFMEAVVLGNGVIRVRATIVKSLSSLVTISSGGSIGREGSMVQLASMLGSLLGRLGKFSPARLRLLVACGAAAGIACAYNAPLTGAFFVAEIVLGSIAMESIGPLIVSSVVATVVASQFLGAQPVYRMPNFGSVPNWQLVAHALLGVFAGLCAPLFLLLLRGGETVFSRMQLPVFVKLGLGGLIVGRDLDRGTGRVGQRLRRGRIVLNNPWTWQALMTILVFKVLATVATTGSGAVGGVFTPTLFCGAVLGALYGEILRALLPARPDFGRQFCRGRDGLFSRGDDPRADHVDPDHVRDDARRRDDHAVDAGLRLGLLRRAGRESRIGLQPAAPRQPRRFRDAALSSACARLDEEGPPLRAGNFRFQRRSPRRWPRIRSSISMWSMPNRRFLGAIALQDLKPFLHDTDLPQVVIALDLMHDDVPVLTSDASLKESLEVFARHDGERLPVLDNPRDRRLVGSLAKTDVLLTLAHGIGGAEAD